jgi:hypothetical protein
VSTPDPGRMPRLYPARQNPKNCDSVSSKRWSERLTSYLLVCAERGGLSDRYPNPPATSGRKP